MDKKTRRNLFIVLGIFLLVTAILGIAFLPFIRDLNNPEYRENFSVWVSGRGIWGPVILFGIQVLQIVVAVIPGGPIQIIAGAAFGTWKGLVIIISGCITATMMVFFLVRKFGMPLIKKFFSQDIIDNWSFFHNEKRTAFITFILFLIPGTPKDLLTYLAPLSKLSLLHFTFISIFARFPGMLISSVMGNAAIQGQFVLFFLIAGVTTVIGLLGINFKDRIIAKIRK